MGLWGGFKAAITLGGSYRLDKANERYKKCCETFERLRNGIAGKNQEIERRTSELRSSVALTKRTLRRAKAMIAPACLSAITLQEHPLQHEIVRTGRVHGMAVPIARSSNWGSSELTIGGAAIGTSAAIVAWQGAQVIGIASTGTAMLGLHGAAATNAGWALFGGGSLATGGGGMALGHLVLPGVGAAIAVGVAAVSTHREANKLNASCERIEHANSENSKVLATLDVNLQRLCKAQAHFESADEELVKAVKHAKRRLRRFGILTVFYRFMRFKLSGVYYTEAEWLIVGTLDDAVRKFFASMSVVRQ